ncbi:hypothetical protein SR39_30320 [Methylobacterium radiotolerans]|jgi:hypothetical protein|nr:hypothetical protein SR39_30320 [Methylobacterium radiotolerans]
MSAPRSEFEEEALDTLILAAFRQALREKASGPAEHLLRALEALANDAGSPARASACLDDAYLSLAGVAQGDTRARHRNTM